MLLSFFWTIPLTNKQNSSSYWPTYISLCIYLFLSTAVLTSNVLKVPFCLNQIIFWCIQIPILSLDIHEGKVLFCTSLYRGLKQHWHHTGRNEVPWNWWKHRLHGKSQIRSFTLTISHVSQYYILFMDLLFFISWFFI